MKIRTFLKTCCITFYLHIHQISYESVPEIIGRWPKFDNRGKIKLGDSCRFREYRVRQVISVIDKDAILQFGEHCFIGDGVNICASKKIIIGAYTKLAPMVSIYDTNFHKIQENEEVFRSDISIGRNVWIGQSSIIMPGVIIGDHSVIGANSVVTREIPPKVVAAGSPAKIIKYIDCSDSWTRP